MPCRSRAWELVHTKHLNPFAALDSGLYTGHLVHEVIGLYDETLFMTNPPMWQVSSLGAMGIWGLLAGSLCGRHLPPVQPAGLRRCTRRRHLWPAL